VIVVMLLAMLCCGILNAVIEFVAYRPLRSAPRLAPLITAIGVSFILEDVGLAWKGPNYVNFPDVMPHSDAISVAGVDIGWNKLIVLIITVPVLLLLLWLVQNTRQGKAMRATAQDMDASAIMGIDVNRTISFTFLIAGGLAGAAGLLYSLYVTTVRFDQGFQLGLIAFTAAVLGGIGNLPGAVLGAILIGLIQAFNEGLGWHAPGSDWTESIVFSILILILVFRPEGLLGERTPEGG
jgi:branched-chain amino acid transport system permease protein